MNAIIPKAPRAGERLSAAQMQQVVAAIRRFMPIAGVGVRVSYTQGGTVIHAKPSKTGGSAPSKLPWTFKCEKSTDPETGDEIRTGGWTNCRCQIGLDIDWASKDILFPGGDVDESAIPEGTHWISGTETTADGLHALKVTLGSAAICFDTAEIVVIGSQTESDPVAGILYIPIGWVTNGKLDEPAPHINPVIYKYL
jgi:hypothetical protein